MSKPIWHPKALLKIKAFVKKALLGYMLSTCCKERALTVTCQLWNFTALISPLLGYVTALDQFLHIRIQGFSEREDKILWQCAIYGIL